jgi:hypothetical protein
LIVSEGTSSVTTAVIFAPAATGYAEHIARCLDYCTVKGYVVSGVITGNLPAAVAMLISHTAGVIVTARPEHLAGLRGAGADAEPRIEFAVPPDPPNARREQRRSRVIRRDAAT